MKNGFLRSVRVAAVPLTLAVLTGWAMEMQSNLRPVSPLGDNGIEENLQELLNGITLSGPRINAVSDQASAALFRPDLCSPAVVTRFPDWSRIAEMSTVGIYSAAEPSNRAVVFVGKVAPGTQAQIGFTRVGGVTVNGKLAATDFELPFGFFMENRETGVFFSEDSRNPAGRAQALIFRGTTDTQLNAGGRILPFGAGAHLVSFEDRGAGTGDSDYQDLMIMMTGIMAVGEEARHEACDAAR